MTRAVRNIQWIGSGVTHMESHFVRAGKNIYYKCRKQEFRPMHEPIPSPSDRPGKSTSSPQYYRTKEHAVSHPK